MIGSLPFFIYRGGWWAGGVVLAHLPVILASSWRHLDSSWLIFASSWRHLGSSWRHLGVILAHPGSSWRHLGVILAHLGVILAHLGSSWRILANLGSPWRHLGSPCRHLGVQRALGGVIFEHQKIVKIELSCRRELNLAIICWHQFLLFLDARSVLLLQTKKTPPTAL